MKRLITKIVAFLTVSSMMLSLTACGGSSTSSPASSSAAGGSASGIGSAETQQPKGYPSKPVNWIIPVAAGSNADILSRADASAMKLGGSIAITNMPGANQSLGITEVKNRPADGYYLFTAAYAGIIVQPLVAKVSYSLDDFRYLASLTSFTGNEVVVPTSSGIKSFDDLVAKMKSGSKLAWSSANVGSVAQLGMLSIMDELGISADYVSYNGTSESINALLGKHIDFLVLDDGLAKQYVDSGEFTPILTVSDQRDTALYPDVPCAKELGYKNMDVFKSILVVGIRKDTPNDVADWMKKQVNDSIKSDAFQKAMKSTNNVYSEPMSEDEVTKALYSARDVYKGIIDKYLKK